MITEKTRRYWLNVLRDWAEDRLSPPQYDECCAALDAMKPVSTDDELPPEHEDILWWYPRTVGRGWKAGYFEVDEEVAPGLLMAGNYCWYLCDGRIGDGPTWWMYPPSSPEEEK